MTRNIRTWLPVLTFGLMLAPLRAETTVIQNATILTISNGTIKGSILIRDGKIAAVGDKIQVPADAKVIDKTFNRNDPTSYNKSTALTVYDKGGKDSMCVNFSKDKTSKMCDRNPWLRYFFEERIQLHMSR